MSHLITQFMSLVVAAVSFSCYKCILQVVPMLISLVWLLFWNGNIPFLYSIAARTIGILEFQEDSFTVDVIKLSYRNFYTFNPRRDINLNLGWRRQSTLLSYEPLSIISKSHVYQNDKLRMEWPIYDAKDSILLSSLLISSRMYLTQLPNVCFFSLILSMWKFNFFFLKMWTSQYSP